MKALQLAACSWAAGPTRDGRRPAEIARYSSGLTHSNAVISARPKLEIRSTKPAYRRQVRNKFKTQMTECSKQDFPTQDPPVWDIRISVIRACFGFRVSDFGFLICG
jgi:hypothetical protein